MPEITLSQINIFPIKSLGGLSLSHTFAGETGLSFDRRFMLSNPDGELISARQFPQLLKFSTLLRDDGIEVIAPDGEHLSIRYPELFNNYRQVRVWGNEINAQHCGEQFDEWFSRKLDSEVQLLFFGEQSERFTSRKPDKAVAFADGYPLLLISEASLEDLNLRSSAKVTMDHFRTNLVVRNSLPFAEDSWQRIRIGEVEFELVKPCSRCVMTTFDPLTAKPVAHGEPIQTLARYRMGEENEVYFGQNLVALNEGLIREGDRVEVLETRPPACYPDNAPPRISGKQPQASTLWPDGKPLELLCSNRIEETRDVVTFRFSLPEGVHTTYSAGQFLTLNLTIDGENISRCYTLSSSPNRTTDLAITVKRVTEGRVSNWLHQHLQVGDRIEALPPQGEFHLQNSGEKPLLLLSAGSGITPMLSIARQLSDQQSARDILFYHQARTEADLICEDELLWLARQNPRLKLIFSLSQPEDDWQGVRGRISQEQLQTLVPDLHQRQVMCCGPEGFMQHAREYSLALGLPESQWLEESFAAPPGVAPEPECYTHSIQINGQQFTGNNQASLLDQAEQQGISIPSGCRAGVCGSCKVRLIEGEVLRSSEIPLSEEEKSNHIILACSCLPESDLKIEF